MPQPTKSPSENKLNHLIYLATSKSLNEFLGYCKTHPLTIKNYRNHQHYNILQIALLRKVELTESSFSFLFADALAYLYDVGKKYFSYFIPANETAIQSARHPLDDVIDVLIEFDPHLLNYQAPPFGYTALHLTVSKEDAELTKALIQSPRMDCNIQCKEGNTALHMAFIIKKLALIKLLLPRTDLSLTNQKGETPITIAAQYKESEYLMAIIDYCASVNPKSKSKKHPTLSELLFIAAGFNHPSCIQQLLEKHNTSYSSDANGCTPFYYACVSKSNECIQLLKDLDAKFVDPKTGNAAIHRCMIYRSSSHLLKLMEGDPQLNLNEINKKSETALHLAINFLTPHKKDPQNDAKDLEQLLKCIALFANHQDTQLTIADNNGNTIFHLMATSNHPLFHLFLPRLNKEIIKEIFKPNKEGNTPLHLAAKTGKLEILKQFLSVCGPDFLKTIIDQPNHKDQTAFDLAQACHHKACEAALIEFGSIGKRTVIMPLPQKVTPKNESKSEIIETEIPIHWETKQVASKAKTVLAPSFVNTVYDEYELDENNEEPEEELPPEINLNPTPQPPVEKEEEPLVDSANTLFLNSMEEIQRELLKNAKVISEIKISDKEKVSLITIPCEDWKIEKKASSIHPHLPKFIRFYKNLLKEKNKNGTTHLYDQLSCHGTSALDYVAPKHAAIKKSDLDLFIADNDIDAMLNAVIKWAIDNKFDYRFKTDGIHRSIAINFTPPNSLNYIPSFDISFIQSDKDFELSFARRVLTIEGILVNFAGPHLNKEGTEKILAPKEWLVDLLDKNLKTPNHAELNKNVIQKLRTLYHLGNLFILTMHIEKETQEAILSTTSVDKEMPNLAHKIIKRLQKQFRLKGLVNSFNLLHENNLLPQIQVNKKMVHDIFIRKPLYLTKNIWKIKPNKEDDTTLLAIQLKHILDTLFADNDIQHWLNQYEKQLETILTNTLTKRHTLSQKRLLLRFFSCLVVAGIDIYPLLNKVYSTLQIKPDNKTPSLQPYVQHASLLFANNQSVTPKIDLRLVAKSDKVIKMTK